MSGERRPCVSSSIIFSPSPPIYVLHAVIRWSEDHLEICWSYVGNTLMICCFCVDDDFHRIWRKVGVEVVWDEQTDRKKSLGSNNDNRDDDDECGNDNLQWRSSQVRMLTSELRSPPGWYLEQAKSTIPDACPLICTSGNRVWSTFSFYTFFPNRGYILSKTQM